MLFVSLRDALRREPARVSSLIAASTLGVYLLILVGLTDALTDAAVTCPAWPACGGQWPSPTDPRVAVVYGHRALAVLVGTVLVVTVVLAWQRRLERRVRAAVVGAVALYPVEVWIGALTVVDGGSTLLTTLHLVVAMTIFSGLLAALCWQLESEGPTAQSRVSDGPLIDATGRGTTSPAESDTAVEKRLTETPRRRVWAYVRLTKPKLWWLLCLVALASMTLAAGGFPPTGTVVATLGGGVLAIGASGTFNNVFEHDRDERMSRTDDRPLVTGTVPIGNAVAFGLALTVTAVGVLLAFVNVLAAGLGLLAILFYSVVYTLVLKPRTTKNVVLGGAVGAFPALIGWAAVTETVGIPAITLGAVIFLWTPAHFYALALAHKDDYARAGFPMLPVVRGEATTRHHIVGYLGATLLGAVILKASAGLNWAYATAAIGGGAVFLWAVVQLHRERTDHAAFRAFMASNAYLGALLAAIVIDTTLV